MTQLTCTEVRDAAAEYALDILDPTERSVIAAHLLRCPACRAEVDSMSAVGTQLLQLVPGTEPPLGFDHRVLARVGEHRHSWAGRARRHPRILAAVAAAVAFVVGVIGWTAGRDTTSVNHRVLLTAALHEGARTVGHVEAYEGHPGWVMMTVHGVTGTAWVTCQITEKGGQVVQLGSFPLVGGNGEWGTPDSARTGTLSGVRLVAADGRVIATAVFR
jgi:anti-sigma factor RsiW